MVNGTALYISLGILITLVVGGPMLWYQNKGQEKRLRLFELEHGRLEDQSLELTSLQDHGNRLQTILDQQRDQCAGLIYERDSLKDQLRATDEDFQRARHRLGEAENIINRVRVEHAAAENRITAAIRRQIEDERKLRLLQEKYDFVELRCRALAAEHNE